MKEKKCRQCKEKFKPANSMQVVCSPKCAIEYERKQTEKKIKEKEKEERKKTREAKERLKTKSDWAKEAQDEFNKFIRLRDSHQPCISCGKHRNSQYHAGHYRTVGAHPELRFNEDNCHKQCAHCNNHKSGNIVEYRLNLIKRIGQERLDFMEGPHEPAKYNIDDLRQIKAEYRKKWKELEKDL